MPFEDTLPDMQGEVPGPRSRALAARLVQHECPDTTYVGADLPVFWERARGANVWDVDGNRYVDLTAAFGVATLGHAHPEVVRALRQQSERLVHGMGDVHPSEVKVQLAEDLARLAPGALDVCILGSSGTEAVEAAMKTSAIASGRPGLLAFEGAYHGLGYGALSLTWREHFRAPFEAQLSRRVTHVPFPGHGEAPDVDAAAAAARALERVDEALARPTGDDIGAVFVEPILGRGGVVVPHASFLTGLREICTRRQRLLVADEIFTGLGRTGHWFAVQGAGVVPDLLCIGKSLAGGMALSACLGSVEVMQRWERSRGEARHTHTFLGHPLACAAARAHIAVLEREDWPARIGARGARFGTRLQSLRELPGVAAVRGQGFFWGLELRARDGGADAERTTRVMVAALQRGWIVLPAGSAGNVLELAPPFVLGERQEDGALAMLHALLNDTAPSRHASRAAPTQARHAPEPRMHG